MLQHAGEDSKVFRQVCELGKMLGDLSVAGVPGSVLERSDTAILFSAESEWATRCETLPSQKLNHWHDVRDWYRAFLDAGMRADVVPLKYDWSEYSTVVLPSMLILSASDTQRLADFVASGGQVVIGYATGLLDEHFHVWLGGYPGAGDGLLRKMLGVRGEEFNILGREAEGEPYEIELGEGMEGAVTRLWQNDVNVEDPSVEVLATYSGKSADDWGLEGVAAVTRNTYGSGTAYFVGCDLSVADLTMFIRANLAASDDVAGIRSDDVLHTVRKSADAVFDFYMPRGKKEVVLRGIEGEPICQFRAESEKSEGPGESGSYIIRRNGMLITKRQS